MYWTRHNKTLHSSTPWSKNLPSFGVNMSRLFQGQMIRRKLDVSTSSRNSVVWLSDFDIWPLTSKSPDKSCQYVASGHMQFLALAGALGENLSSLSSIWFWRSSSWSMRTVFVNALKPRVHWEHFIPNFNFPLWTSGHCTEHRRTVRQTDKQTDRQTGASRNGFCDGKLF